MSEKQEKINDILNKSQMQKEINKIKKLAEYAKKEDRLKQKLKIEQELIQQKIKKYEEELNKNLVSIEEKIKLTSNKSKAFYKMLGLSEFSSDFHFDDEKTYDFLKVRMQEICNTKLEYVMLITSIEEVVEEWDHYDKYEVIKYKCYTLLIPEEIKQEVLLKEKLYNKTTFNKLLQQKNVFLLHENSYSYTSCYKEYSKFIEGKTIKKINNDLYWEVAEQYLINKTIAENNFKKQSIKQKYEEYKKEMQEMEDILQEIEK